MSERTERPKSQKRTIYIKQFRHWRSGRIIRAEDYGLKAFKIER